MNRLFVNVKVDREERPDVDAIYMDAVQAMTGRGGWPMTVFLTPDGQPFFGGTYFPKPAASSSCSTGGDRRRLAQPARRRSSQNAERSTERDRPARRAVAPADDLPGAETLNAALQQLGGSVRRRVGRVRRGPEVPVDDEPRPRCCARYRRRADDDAGDAIVTTTLDAMARGGIYDHLGGGFARYSVDERVARAPLREDALRPGAAGPRVPPRAGRSPGEPRYRQVRRRDDRLRAPRPAPPRRRASTRPRTPTPDETVGDEGKFYVWTPDEVREPCSATTPTPRSSGTASPTAATSRAATSRAGCTTAATCVRPPAIEQRAGALFDASATAAAAGPRRQGAHRVERADARRRWPRPPPRSADADWIARGRRQRRVPARASCATPTAAGSARGRPTARRRRAHAALAADHAALVDAFTRLAEATGEARWIDEAAADRRRAARPLLGRRQRRAVHHRPTTPRRSSRARRT